RGGGERPLQAQDGPYGDDPQDGHRDRQPARGRARPLHRPDRARGRRARRAQARVGVRGRPRVRGVPPVRRGRRDQLQARPARPAQAAAAPGVRAGLRVRRRLRRARPRPARLAAVRLRAGRPVRGRGRSDRQHLAPGQAPGVGPLTPGTPVGTRLSVAERTVTSVNRTDRLYALVEDLRAISPRCRSARELAERFEVSVRTIERDIAALQESGVPIYAEPGRRGGYELDKHIFLPPLNFTPAEAAATAVALTRA